MQNEFNLTVITPDKKFCSQSVTEVVFSTPEGRVGIMAGHMPIIAAVAEGTIDIYTGGVSKTAAISQGFAEITPTCAEFFVDTVEWADEIDVIRAKEALDRAALRLKSELSRVEYVRTRASMARALARIKAAGQS